MPFIPQVETTECGLACLAMIAGYHGRHLTLDELRKRFDVSSHGTALPALLEIAEALELGPRPLRISLQELKELRSPALLHWNFDHFVVLTKAGRHRFKVNDPALGERTFNVAEVDRHFTGIAVEFSPQPDFATSARTQVPTLTQLWRRAPGFVSAMTQLLMLSLLLQIFALASPFYLQLVVDEVLIRHDADLLPLLAIGFALLGLITVTTRTIRGLSDIHLASRMTQGLGGGLLHRLIRLPMAYFGRRRLGDVLSRFDALKPIQNFITSGSVAMVIDGLLAVTTLLMMAVYSSLLAALVLLSVTLNAGFRHLQLTRVRAASLEAVEAAARVDSSLLETLRLLQGIKLAGREPEREAVWRDELVRSLNAGSKLARLGVFGDTVTGAVTGMEQVLVVFFGANAVLQGSLTVGMLYAFLAYRSHFSSAAASVIGTLIQYRLLEVHLERLSDILLTEPEAGAGDSARFRLPIEGRVTLREASLRYAGSSANLFADFSLDVPAGVFLAVAGPSGIGKSTLLRVLMGLQPLTSGALLVDGHGIETIGHHSYRAALAAVMPEDGLFAGTLADNIVYFDRIPDRTALVAAARCAEVHDEVTALPLGYDSQVSDMGANLSRGQQQRLLIARAVYRRPRVLFLDEGTSHVDARTGARIMRNLRALGLTCIYVTHDESLLSHADQILHWVPGANPQLTKRDGIGGASSPLEAR